MSLQGCGSNAGQAHHDSSSGGCVNTSWHWSPGGSNINGISTITTAKPAAEGAPTFFLDQGVFQMFQASQATLQRSQQSCLDGSDPLALIR